MITSAKQLYALLTSEERRSFFLLAILLTVMACFEVIGVSSIMPFLAMVGDPQIIHTNKMFHSVYSFFHFKNENTFILYSGFFSLILLVASNAVRFVSTWALLRFTHMRNYSLSTRLFHLYLMQPYKFFFTHNSSELEKNVLSEVSIIVSSVLYRFLIIISRGFVMLAIVLFMFTQEPMASSCLFLLFGGSYILAYGFTRKAINTVGWKRTKAMTGRFRSASDTFQSIKEIKATNREPYFYDRFSQEALSFSQQCAISEIIACSPRFVLELIAFGSMIVLVQYFFIADRSIGQILPLLGMYAFCGFKIMPALQQIFEAVTSIKFYSSALELVSKDYFLYRAKCIENIESYVELSYKYKIEFIDVSFSYTDTDNRILNSLNFIIHKNEMIGIVGSTGSGKTTTIDILLGLIEPGDGVVAIDGVPITQENVRSWRKKIGYVPQSINLLDDTVARNIAFGLDPTAVDMEKVVRAAKIANIHDHIVTNMPQGYGSIVGEQGVCLSGGQRQRIGIARALYHDPELLVMDEATSALDTDTEQNVMEAIKTLAGKKTIVMIAHRVSTLAECDRIFVFEQGQVAKIGTYAELYAEKNIFEVSSDNENISLDCASVQLVPSDLGDA